MNKRLSIVAGLAVIAALAFRPVSQAISEMVKPAPVEQNMLGLIYQQRAAEYRALCFQAYNLGMEKVDKAVYQKKHVSNLALVKLAVVTDLDETALDNSGYAVRCYNEGHLYTDSSWNKWCADAVADSVPGSVSFFKYADKKGVEIFYVSNRSKAALAATMENMKRLGFPQVTEAHFMLKTTTSSKEERRREILKTHRIIAFFGDNLVDMDKAFDKAPEAARRRSADSLRKVWGDRYIVLPNATYGDWESALYMDYRKRHPEEKSINMDSIYMLRKNSLINY